MSAEQAPFQTEIDLRAVETGCQAEVVMEITASVDLGWCRFNVCRQPDSAGRDLVLAQTIEAGETVLEAVLPQSFKPIEHFGHNLWTRVNPPIIFRNLEAGKNIQQTALLVAFMVKEAERGTGEDRLWSRFANVLETLVEPGTSNRVLLVSNGTPTAASVRADASRYL